MRTKALIFFKRFTKRGIIIIPILCLLVFLGYIFPVANIQQKYNLSKQFNGRIFVNEDGKINYSAFWDFLRWQSYEFKNKWPQKIPNIYEPRLPKNIDENEIFITFINHATFLIQTPHLNILTDPIFSKRASPLSWRGPKRVHPPGIPLKNLPAIDLILISHNHYDHLDLKSLKKLSKRHSARVFVPLGDQTWLEKEGVTNVIEMDWWKSKKEPAYEIFFLPAKHNSGRGLFSENSSLWGSFLLKTPRAQIYFAGDTAYDTHFKRIEQKFGRIDLAFLPIGAYEPRILLKDIHMNPADAVQAHQDLKAKQSIAMHFGTFQLSDEGYWDPMIDLNKALNQNQVSSHHFFLPRPGQSFRLDLKSSKITTWP